MAVLFISHDMLSIASLCSRVAVLAHGEIIESGPAQEVFSSPSNPFSWSLLRGLPSTYRGPFDTPTPHENATALQPAEPPPTLSPSWRGGGFFGECG